MDDSSDDACVFSAEVLYLPTQMMEVVDGYSEWEQTQVYNICAVIVLK